MMRQEGWKYLKPISAAILVFATFCRAGAFAEPILDRGPASEAGTGRTQHGDVPWTGMGSPGKVIYGADDRIDLYQETDASRAALAKSVCALVGASDLVVAADSIYTLSTYEFRVGFFPPCSDEPFRDQPVAPYCSGFLVGPDIVATAGHCFSEYDLDSTLFVFGFVMTDATTPVTDFTQDAVYRGIEVLGRMEAEDLDYAIVRLDRPVTAPGALPLSIRRSGTPGGGTALGVIGHPAGLPLKLAFGPTTQVYDDSAAGWFAANLDTYGGNSGSPVFNATTGEVEGILVRGASDFVFEPECFRSNVLDDASGAEEVSRSTTFAQFVPELVLSKGRIELDRSTYACVNSVGIEVFDSDLADQTTISVALSSSAGGNDQVVLNRTSPGVFSGVWTPGGGLGEGEFQDLGDLHGPWGDCNGNYVGFVRDSTGYFDEMHELYLESWTGFFSEAYDSIPQQLTLYASRYCLSDDIICKSEWKQPGADRDSFTELTDDPAPKCDHCEDSSAELHFIFRVCGDTLRLASNNDGSFPSDFAAADKVLTFLRESECTLIPDLDCGIGLTLTDGATLTATYVDADDGAGNMAVPATDTAMIDCAPPGISGLVVDQVTSGTARVSVVASEPALMTVTVSDADCVAVIGTFQSAQPSLTPSVTVQGLLPETTYHVTVVCADGEGNVAASSSMECVAFATSRSNFACADAVEIQLDEIVVGDNSQSDFAVAGDAGCRSSYGAWYRFVAPSDGGYGIDTCGSSFDTVLNVYTGSCDAPQRMACNDDSCERSSALCIGLFAGQSIFIEVGAFVSSLPGVFHLRVTPDSNCSGPANPAAFFLLSLNSGTAPLYISFSNLSTSAVSYLWDFGDGTTSSEFAPYHTYETSGTYNVCLTAFGPYLQDGEQLLDTACQTIEVSSTLPGDQCETAIDIPLGRTLDGDNTYAGSQFRIPDVDDGGDMWYRFHPERTGNYNVRLVRSSFDSTLAVYTRDCYDPQLIALNDESWATELKLRLRGQNDIFIRVAGHGAARGKYWIRVSRPVDEIGGEGGKPRGSLFGCSPQGSGRPSVTDFFELVALFIVLCASSQGFRHHG